MESAPTLGNFKSAPKDAGLMPDGSGRPAISFVAKPGRNPKEQAVREADLQTEIQIFMKLQKQARQAGYNRIIEFLPERSCLGPQACLTLELVQPFGCDLFERLTEASPSTTTRAVSQVCEALGFLQSCGVVHGDLKCENVLLASTNDIKLIDFGMAASVGEMRCWGASDNVPKRMRAKTMPAEFSQDLYGVGFIIQQCIWGNKAFKDEVPQAKAATELLLAGRMTLGELVQEPWIGSVQGIRCNIRYSTSPASFDCTPLSKSSVSVYNSIGCVSVERLTRSTCSKDSVSVSVERLTGSTCSTFAPMERLTPSTCNTSTPIECFTPSTSRSSSTRPHADSE